MSDNLKTARNDFTAQQPSGNHYIIDSAKSSYDSLKMEFSKAEGGVSKAIVQGQLTQGSEASIDAKLDIRKEEADIGLEKAHHSLFESKGLRLQTEGTSQQQQDFKTLMDASKTLLKDASAKIDTANQLIGNNAADNTDIPDTDIEQAKQALTEAKQLKAEAKTKLAQAEVISQDHSTGFVFGTENRDWDQVDFRAGGLYPGHWSSQSLDQVKGQVKQGLQLFRMGPAPANPQLNTLYQALNNDSSASREIKIEKGIHNRTFFPDNDPNPGKLVPFDSDPNVATRQSRTHITFSVSGRSYHLNLAADVNRANNTFRYIPVQITPNRHAGEDLSSRNDASLTLHEVPQLMTRNRSV